MYSQYPESFATGERFFKIYEDIADATPLDKPFQKKDLINDLPSIKHLSIRTQTDIIGVVLREMLTLPDEADKLVKGERQGQYQWRISTIGRS